MQSLRLPVNPADPIRWELVRYAANGLVAAAVHGIVLVFCIEILAVPYAGVANLIAALFGITASFIGNRYFVFRSRSESVIQQAARFSLLYAVVACLHASFLFTWADWLKLDYRTGFVLATAMQAMITYLGSKVLVFNK